MYINKNNGNDKCPNCGYCPHCGRSDVQPTWQPWPPYQPWMPQSPPYPQSPQWESLPTTAGNGTYTYNITNWDQLLDAVDAVTR